MVIAHRTVPLENGPDDTLTILDVLHPLYEIIALPGRRVFEAANAPVITRRRRIDMDTVGLADQAYGLGINTSNELYITCNERIDTGNRVGNRGDFQRIKIGTLSPVIFVTDMLRF